MAFAHAGAQTPTGGLEGIIQDRSQARIASAAVQVTTRPDGRKHATRSSSAGDFRLPALPPGDHELEVTYPGFSRAVKTITIAAGATTRAEITLETSAVSEQVSVSAEAGLIQPDRVTQTTTLTSQQLTSLPTASRNYTHLVVGEAGVSAPLPDRTGRGLNLATTPGTQSEDGSQSLNPSVNGARPTNNSLSINGIDTTNMLNASGGLGSNISVPLDAVDVIEVQTALYAANTGRNGGGNIQVVTKSGSNEYHGSGFHFLQNEKLNANEFFLNRAGTPRPEFRRNESGATLGGPIVKNRTFFFASVQRLDFLSGYASNANAATGLPTGLTDTRTRESIAAVANEYVATGAADNPAFVTNLLTAVRRFPADQIPGLESKFFTSVEPGNVHLRRLTAADIHPVAVNILNQKRDGLFLIPSPTSALPVLRGNGTYGREYLLQQVLPTSYKSWAGSGSIEHNFADKNRLRLNYIRTSQLIEEAFGWADASPSPTYGDNSSWTGSLSDIHTISPRWVNELRGGFFELYNTRISKYRDITNSSLGIYNPLEVELGGLAALMPTIDINTQRNSGGIGNAWDFFDRQRTIHIADQMTWTTGRSTLYFGGEFRRPTIKGEYMSRTNGDLDYESWLFFFTGHGAAGGGSDLDQGDTRRHFKMKDFGLFIQEDWKPRPGLTINAGLRWDYYGNMTEADGKIGNYYLPETAARLGVNPGFQVPGNSVLFQPGFYPLKLGLVLDPGARWDLNQVNRAINDSTLTTDWNNFAPRVGLAWQIPRMRNIVLRAGYGIFYERPAAAFKTDLTRTAPFFMYQNVPAPVDMANPYPTINVNPFALPLNVTIATDNRGTPGWRREDGSTFPATAPFSSKSYAFIDPFIRTPYVQQWTLNVQYEPLSGNLIDIRYVGSRGIGLISKLNIAQPRDPRQTPVNGFSNITNSAGALINPDFFVQPRFLGLNRATGFQILSNWASSTYHALQASYRRRWAHGVHANVAYTWSKSMDLISSDTGLVEHDGFNIANNWGPSDFDRTHRLTAAWLWDLPLRGRWAGGWQLAGMLTAQSGTPFSLIGSGTANATFAQPSRVRVDWAPGMTIDDARYTGRVQDRLDRFFNVAAFQNSNDRWGNTGRNILRGPSQAQWDFSISKTTVLRESVRLEFRWELYNALNTPVFTNPNSTLPTTGTGTAGLITSTIGGPRTMQAALRVRF